MALAITQERPAISAAKRSEIMRAVRGRHTRPEMAVRRLLHAAGYRYRLHAAELPGKPDIVFRGRRKAIFVHGCFWHGHDCKRGARTPKTNRNYWLDKIARNKARDEKVAKALQSQGWHRLVIWECEITAPDLLHRLQSFLEPGEAARFGTDGEGAA